MVELPVYKTSTQQAEKLTPVMNISSEHQTEVDEGKTSADDDEKY